MISKKILLLLLFTTFSFLNLLAQKIIKTEKVTENSIHVIGNNFEGAIFSDKDVSGILLSKGQKRFTPTEIDIILVEKSLRSCLDTNKSVSGENVLIKQKLKKYLRQYFGYLNDTGERIVIVNFLWSSPDIKAGNQWLKEYVEVLDGGYHYWQVKFNLDILLFFDLYINGVA